MVYSNCFSCLLTCSLIGTLHLMVRIADCTKVSTTADYRDIIDGVKYESLGTFYPDMPKAPVKVMEIDMHNPDRVLIISGNSLWSMSLNDKLDISRVAGSTNCSGCNDGVGKGARFYSPKSFIQVNKSVILIPDHGNHCIRGVNRTTNETYVAAGECTVSGNKDNKDSRFFNPYTIVRAEYPGKFYITDENNDAVRIMNDRTVTTLTSRSPLNNPRGMAKIRATLYVTFKHGIIQIDIKSGKQERITSSCTDSGFTDGPLIEAKFYNPTMIQRATDKSLMIVDSGNHRLRMLDLRTKTVSSICIGSSGTTDGDIAKCEMKHPYSILLVKDRKKIYIGEQDDMRQLEISWVKEAHSPGERSEGVKEAHSPGERSKGVVDEAHSPAGGPKENGSSMTTTFTAIAIAIIAIIGLTAVAKRIQIMEMLNLLFGWKAKYKQVKAQKETHSQHPFHDGNNTATAHPEDSDQ